MISDRLEFHYSTSSKVIAALIGPILLGIFGILMLREGIATFKSSDGKLITLLGFGFPFLLFILSLVRVPKVLTNKPQIVIDEKGITDNQRWKTLIIPWDDIREVSFPYRDPSLPTESPAAMSVSFGSRSKLYAVSIKFRDPQRYRLLVPLKHVWRSYTIRDAGDYEISLYTLDKTAFDVYDHLQNLQRGGRIPSTIKIKEVGSSSHF
jgi:hypothetical protein